MDPNTYFEADPNDPKTPSNVHLEQGLVEQLIEKYAPRIDIKESPTRIAVVLCDPGSAELFQQLRCLGLEKGIDLFIPTIAEYDDSERQTRVILDVDKRSLSADLEKLFKELDQLTREQMCEEVFKTHPIVEPSTDQPDDNRSKKKLTVLRYKQFQINHRNHQPNLRRQFAQIRPPRRGGR